MGLGLIGASHGRVATEGQFKFNNSAFGITLIKVMPADVDVAVPGK